MSLAKRLSQTPGAPARTDTRINDVRQRVHWVSHYDGGRGATRELIELVLKAQGRFDAIVASFPHIHGNAGSPSARDIANP